MPSTERRIGHTDGPIDATCNALKSAFEKQIDDLGKLDNALRKATDATTVEALAIQISAKEASIDIILRALEGGSCPDLNKELEKLKKALAHLRRPH